MTSGYQIAKARELLGWSLEDLELRSGQSAMDIARIEAGQSNPWLKPCLTTIRSALKDAGVEFLEHEQPGVRLRKQEG